MAKRDVKKHSVNELNKLTSAKHWLFVILSFLGGMMMYGAIFLIVSIIIKSTEKINVAGILFAIILFIVGFYIKKIPRKYGIVTYFG